MSIDSVREKVFHDLVIQNDNIKRDLLSILNLEVDLSRLELIHEDKYINGIFADFTVVYDSSINAIIECKSNDIGVTDYVRGIGQVMQYEYFFEKNISSKGYKYVPNFKTILLIPSSVLQNRSFNVGKFKYPVSTFLVEINEISNVARQVSRKELDELATVDEDTKLTSISQYYVRDTRLFELYMLLRYLCMLKLKGIKTVNRTKIEKEVQRTETINNRNWRNVWISLSSLGFIDSNNMPSPSGAKIGMLEYDEFLLLVYKSYIKPYVDLIMSYFSDVQNGNNNLTKRYKDINEDFRKMYADRDILFLTQSNGRYLSSWLNILRDDFGCISFAPRTSNRRITYKPSELNDTSFKQKIRENTISTPYINKLNAII
ncbi:hypothetical protein Fleli_1543 [Bernardetia litoralis DSM 6794]|uniref:Uncharacterized protein n=1 Tax=Bernardetia litoralis (strain ATCC 23117 / DSM 6794 / NBRC 15988 / NCIMB 1366 / Fx l1 / Sio-4) TaxID=880071 RepID=I4AJ29_BERLS|nr:hypothetical protein [Bernardetia litoralis]AFM03964.1 hypothetical protein Fleli_1543 [Bernardetia litoralis DSM 6794]